MKRRTTRAKHSKRPSQRRQTAIDFYTGTGPTRGNAKLSMMAAGFSEATAVGHPERITQSLELVEIQRNALAREGLTLPFAAAKLKGCFKPKLGVDLTLKALAEFRHFAKLDVESPSEQLVIGVVQLLIAVTLPLLPTEKHDEYLQLVESQLTGASGRRGIGAGTALAAHATPAAA